MHWVCADCGEKVTLHFSTWMCPNCGRRWKSQLKFKWGEGERNDRRPVRGRKPPVVVD